jgi:trigger factor
MTKVTTTKTAQPKAETLKREFAKHLDGTIELNIIVPVDIVKKERAKIEEFFIKNLAVPGFRKGKAPKEIARRNLNEEKIREELLRKVVTDEYKKAIEKHKIQPILTPQIHIEAFEDGKELKFTAQVAEEPKVELGDYKKAIKEITAKSKIVIKKGKEPEKLSIDDIITAGISTAKVRIPNIIVEREVSRLLSQMIDEIKMLGMTLESYLESKKITVEQLREDYKTRAERDIKLEFFLRKVADENKITVTAEDITAAIAKIEDKNQQEEIKKNPYLVASIIRQQKTIDFLTQI